MKRLSYGAAIAAAALLCASCATGGGLDRLSASLPPGQESSIDESAAGPAGSAIAVPCEKFDISVIPSSNPYYSSLYSPFFMQDSIRLDPATGNLVYGYRERSFQYYLCYVDLAAKTSKKKSLTYSTSLAQLIAGRADFLKRMRALRPLELFITYRAPEDPAYLALTRSGKYTVPSRQRPPQIVWEALCLDPPLSMQMLRGPASESGVLPDDPNMIIVSYKDMLVIRPAASREELLATIKPEYLFPGGFSVIDGRDPEGFDRAGNDAEGYDRLGWNAAGLDRDGDRWSGRKGQKGMEGYGALRRADGSYLIGRFESNEPDGLMAAVSTDGRIEVQSWSGGKLESSRPPAGALAPPLGSFVYLGTAARGGMAEGRGEAIGLDGARLAGDFIEGKLASGRIEGTDGSVYEGGLVDGRPQGKGRVVAADGTAYAGEFAAGSYEGKGVITRPGGERYEGEFRAGQPHGSGIYINGSTIERCEYYEGKRIDQAYLIRVENEKQLEALRAERERIAKEKADKAEQDRIAAERAAAAVAASKEKSSNNLIAGLFGVGAALAGGSIGMNLEQAALFGASTAMDVAKGDASMSTMKATGQAIVDSKAGKSAAAGSAAGSSAGGSSAGPRTYLPNLLMGKPELMSFDQFKDDDFQLYSQCATANMYYGEYKAKVDQGRPEAEASRIYEMHRIAANNALMMWAGIEKARAEKAARQAAPQKPAPRQPAPAGSAEPEPAAGSSDPRAVIPR